MDPWRPPAAKLRQLPCWPIASGRTGVSWRRTASSGVLPLEGGVLGVTLNSCQADCETKWPWLSVCDSAIRRSVPSTMRRLRASRSSCPALARSEPFDTGMSSRLGPPQDRALGADGQAACGAVRLRGADLLCFSAQASRRGSRRVRGRADVSRGLSPGRTGLRRWRRRGPSLQHRPSMCRAPAAVPGACTINGFELGVWRNDKVRWSRPPPWVVTPRASTTPFPLMPLSVLNISRTSRGRTTSSWSTIGVLQRLLSGAWDARNGKTVQAHELRISWDQPTPSQEYCRWSRAACRRWPHTSWSVTREPHEFEKRIARAWAAFPPDRPPGVCHSTPNGSVDPPRVPGVVMRLLGGLWDASTRSRIDSTVHRMVRTAMAHRRGGSCGKP